MGIQDIIAIAVVVAFAVLAWRRFGRVLRGGPVCHTGCSCGKRARAADATSNRPLASPLVKLKIASPSPVSPAKRQR